MRTVGRYASEDEAARAVNAAIRRAGLEGKRNINAVDATTGALVPRERTKRSDRSAVVTPDAARAPTEPTSKFWGVRWDSQNKRWRADVKDADGKTRSAGLHDTQELAAHAYNAAVRALPADVQARRKTNPVVDGRLVPRPPRKRRRDEFAAPPPAPSRRRVVSAPPPRERDDVALDRTAAYLQTAPTPDDAEGFRAAAGLALTCIDAWHAWNAASV